MARKEFVIEGGLKIVAADSDSGASILNGDGAPAGDAALGSIYQDITNGEMYIKKVAGAGAGNWELMADATYVADAIAAIPAVDLTPYLKHDGTVAMSGDLNLDGNSIKAADALNDASGNAIIDLTNSQIFHYNAGTTNNEKKIDWNTHQLFSPMSGLGWQEVRLDWSGADIIISEQAFASDQAISTKKYVNDQIAAIPAVDLSPYFKHDGSVPLSGNVTANADNINLADDIHPFFSIEVQNARCMKYHDGGISLQELKLLDSTGFASMNFSARTLLGTDGIAVVGDWGATLLQDVDGVASVNWGTRQLSDSADNPMISWDLANITAIQFGGVVDMGNFIIQNLATPTLDYHAATKKYVDDSIDAIPAVDLSAYMKHDGSTPITGTFIPDTPISTIARDIGEPSNPFSDIYCVSLKNGVNTAVVYSTGTLVYGSVTKVDWTLDGLTLSTGNNANIILDPHGTGSVSVSSAKIINLANGVDATDAVNKGQLDAAVVGLIWHDPILDPNLYDDSLTAPPVTPTVNAIYIVNGTGSGAWLGKDGHAMFYNGTAWVDLLGRAIAIGDRFGVSMYASIPVPAGGLTGYDNYVAQVTDATLGSLAYSFHQPAKYDAVFVNADLSYHFGHSYTWNDVWPAGSWVEFSGPAVIIAGDALQYTGNTLNVQAGDGITVNGSNQLELVLDGSIAATGDISMGSHQINDLSDGTLSTDAATFGQVSAVADDVGHLVTLSGVAVDSDNLGTFTGVTLSDTETVKSALQTLETAHEAVKDDVGHLVTLSGVAVDSNNLGAFTGITLGDTETVKTAFQTLETAHETVAGKVDDLVTLSGVAANSENLGTFTGDIIADDSTVKTALQALETELVDTRGNADDLITLSGVAENATSFGSFTGTSFADDQTSKQLFQRIEVLLEQMKGIAVTGVTTSQAVDSVPVASVGAVKWLVEVTEAATPANKKSMEIYALNNGTSADFTEYAKLSLGIPFNLTVDVDINSGNMRLLLASTTAGVNVKVRRIEVVSSAV
jgi:hypothetical protein